MDPISADTITSDIYAGPFHERQKAAGGTFYEDMGGLWTQAFSDPVGEYWAVRRGTAIWDVSSLVKFRLTGTDALAALDRLTTRRLSGADPGVIRYGMILDERGRMLDEGTSLAVSPTEAYFFGNDERERFVEHLNSHTRDLEVTIENVTTRIPNIAVQGPGSYALLSALSDTDFAGLGWFRFIPQPVRIAGVPGLLSRTGFTGELGYEFFLLDEGEGAGRLWDAIVEAGAAPIGLDAIEMLRVEAGLVIQEEDYFPGETDPYDLSLDSFIDIDGHAFVGREAAAETATAPPRRFKTLVFEGDGVPEQAEPVTKDGVVVGDVRSAERTPRYGVIALAVLQSRSARKGDTVEVGERTATVKGLPIDDPKKERPRSDPRNPKKAG
ncbi:MAG: aminomethyltransferase family protein [Actinomycetota bacterium]